MTAPAQLLRQRYADRLASLALIAADNGRPVLARMLAANAEAVQSMTDPTVPASPTEQTRWSAPILATIAFAEDELGGVR